MYLNHIFLNTSLETSDLIPIWIFIAGLVAAFIVGLIAYIRKFGAMENQIEFVSEGWREFRDDIKELINRVARIEGSINRNQVTSSDSPRVLNDTGKKTLKTSGIDKIVEDRIDEITDFVRSMKPENAYQVQQIIIDYVAGFSEKEELKNELENGAFNSGYEVSTVLYVGSIYIRDKILPRFSYLPEEVDEHDPDKKKSD